MDEPAIVERLAKALDPAAFYGISQKSTADSPRLVYEELCDTARAQVRAVLAEIEAMGLVIVPREPLPAGRPR